MWDAVTDARSDSNLLPLSVGEIVTRIERRLDWYGLPQCGVKAVEVRTQGAVVATLSVPGQGTFREVIDPWTGAVRVRQLVGGAS